VYNSSHHHYCAAVAALARQFLGQTRASSERHGPSSGIVLIKFRVRKADGVKCHDQASRLVHPGGSAAAKGHRDWRAVGDQRSHNELQNSTATASSLADRPKRVDSDLRVLHRVAGERQVFWRGGVHCPDFAIVVEPSPMQTYTERDFDSLSFHENPLRGISLREEKDGTELVLDIDYLVKWIPVEGGCEWLIAAADLTFYGVTGLKLLMDSHDEKYQCASGGDCILSVDREIIVPQLVYLDRPYWRWQFGFALGTQLSFGTYGFTLRLRQEPIRCVEQGLPFAQRA
jgi:hypothetical protein